MIKATSMPKRGASTSSGFARPFVLRQPTDFTRPIPPAWCPTVPAGCTNLPRFHSHPRAPASRCRWRQSRAENRRKVRPWSAGADRWVFRPRRSSRRRRAFEIAQAAAGILYCLPKGQFWTCVHGRPTDVVPEGPRAHDQRHNGVEKGAAEDRDHRVVRHYPIQKAPRGCRRTLPDHARPRDRRRKGDNAGRSGRAGPTAHCDLQDGSPEKPG